MGLSATTASDLTNADVGLIAPRTSALPEMAPAIMILDEAREVEYVNQSAVDLFAPIAPVGCTMSALLTSCGAKGGDGIFDAVEYQHDVTCRIRLNDDRLLDCTMRRLSGGGFVLSLDDVTQYVQDAETAQRDALTGLPSRRVFLERLAERISDANNSNEEFALLFIDLDRFKAVNDSLGHPVGDALLRKVAGRLNSAVQEGDIVARLGGDEFAILQAATGTQPGGAQTLAARLVDLVSRAYVLEGHTLHVGASVGIAIFPKHGADANALLKHADLALYGAKAAGRGAYRLFEPEMNSRIQARRSMETDLRRALALKELHLVYQPQCDAKTGNIAGFEALLRWSNAKRGSIPPAEFIPLAEEIGIIVPISEWVLRNACREAASWPRPATLSVNISPVQFRNGRLIESVTSALAHSGLSPERLELEVTESALLDQSDEVLRSVASLQELGVKIAMDDFGTGFSSLSYLQQFPFNRLKIDRSFICDINSKPEQLALLRAITGMAVALGMSTTAEGVETAEELACIRAEGCTQVQGFLTGPPMKADALSALFTQHAFMHQTEVSDE